MTVPSPAPPEVVYLNHAATAPLCERAVAGLRHGMRLVGNPSSRHRAGQEAHDALDAAREQVAALLGCTPDQPATAEPTCGYRIVDARWHPGHDLAEAVHRHRTGGSSLVNPRTGTMPGAS